MDMSTVEPNGVERTDEICADVATNRGDKTEHIEEHGEICGRSLLRETIHVASRQIRCVECQWVFETTRNFGPDECPECGEGISMDAEDYVQTELYCRMHGSNIPVKSQVIENIRTKNQGNNPLQYVDGYGEE